MYNVRIEYAEIQNCLNKYESEIIYLEDTLGLLNQSMQRIFIDSEGKAIDTFEEEYSNYQERYMGMVDFLKICEEQAEQVMEALRKADEQNAQDISNTRLGKF